MLTGAQICSCTKMLRRLLVLVLVSVRCVQYSKPPKYSFDVNNLAPYVRICTA